MDISVVVPVYNGEKTINELFSGLCGVLGKKYVWEVIFVHDCGRDGSRKEIERLERENAGLVKGIYLPLNMGQHRAIIEGIKAASGEYIITMDEDLQHNPVYIPEMIAKMNESNGNADVVYARFRKLKHPGLRIWLSEVLRVMLSRIVPGLYPHYSPYRLIRKETALKLPDINKRYCFIDGSLAMLTGRFIHIDADHCRRQDGRSSYTYYKLLKHAVLIAINYAGRRRREKLGMGG